MVDAEIVKTPPCACAHGFCTYVLVQNCWKSSTEDWEHEFLPKFHSLKTDIGTQWADWSLRPSVPGQHTPYFVLAVTRLHENSRLETGGHLLTWAKDYGKIGSSLQNTTRWGISDVQSRGNMSVNPACCCQIGKTIKAWNVRQRWQQPQVICPSLECLNRHLQFFPAHTKQVKESPVFGWTVWLFSFSLSKWKDFITTTSASVSEASILHAGSRRARNESWAQSWDQVGHPCQRRPRHPTQGATQVQTKADPSIQEQASEEGHPGVCCECFLLL